MVETGPFPSCTKHGQPVFVAVSFDETLLKEGVRVALAVKLFDGEVVSLSKAAKLRECVKANLSIS